MEIIGFTLAGLVLYVVSDRILLAIELKLGKTLENRSLVFFAIIMVLALITFNLIQYMGIQPETGNQQLDEFSNDIQKPDRNGLPAKKLLNNNLIPDYEAPANNAPTDNKHLSQ